MTRTRLLSLWLGVALLGGACGGGGSTPDTPPDTSVHTIDADDANIQYTGRIDFTNAKLPKFALGATYVTARFKGVGVTALIKDEHRYGMWRNYYDAVIDGAIVSKIKINDDVTMYSYPIASGLPYGEHEITIVKRTEPNVGLGYFGGFEIAGVILPPPDRPAHKMLIFGDSITAGSGTEVPDGDPRLLRRRLGPARPERRRRLRARGGAHARTRTITWWASPASASSATTRAIPAWATPGRCRRSTTSRCPR